VLPALASGLLFSLGLTVSQMINPAKVIGLLDVFGDWDPNLAFVMATAIPVTVAGYGCKTAPIAALCFGLHPPTQTKIDRRLTAGAVLFGGGCWRRQDSNRRSRSPTSTRTVRWGQPEISAHGDGVARQVIGRRTGLPRPCGRRAFRSNRPPLDGGRSKTSR
jgi:uncharacterized protein DUF6691